VPDETIWGEEPRPQPVEKTVDELEAIIADEKRVVEGGAAVANEGELPAPAPLSDEEEPPEPEETRRIREQKERFRVMRDQAMQELQQMIDAAPDSSPLKQFLYSEEVRQARMEPLRVAFIKAHGKKGQPGKEE